MSPNEKSPKAEPLLPWVIGIPQGGARFTALFIGAFLVTFTSTLFLSVYPLRFRNEAIYWATPLEAYLLVVVIPVLAFPLAATHFGFCFYFSNFLCSLPRSISGLRFSIWTLLKTTAQIGIVLAVVSRFGGPGFAGLFYMASIVLSFANLKQWETVFGFRYPVWDPRVASVMLLVCLILAANALVWMLSGA